MPEPLRACDLSQAPQLPPSSQVTSFTGQKASDSQIPWPASLVGVLRSLCGPDWASAPPTSLGSGEDQISPVPSPSSSRGSWAVLSCHLVGRIGIARLCPSISREFPFFRLEGQIDIIVIYPHGATSPHISTPSTPMFNRLGRQRTVRPKLHRKLIRCFPVQS